jgi:transporter family protein
MWVLFAFGSALFAGLTAILAKCGIKKTDSTIATAIRTIVVLIFAWMMVFIVGSQNTIANVSSHTMLFLILSGLATGASWLCYFKALMLQDVSKVVPIDKSSIVLTIILAFIVLGEKFTATKFAGMVAITAGTYLMIEIKNGGECKKESNAWLIYAILSAVFASLTSILGKIGIVGIESNLGTAIRTIVVLIMAWMMVFVTGKKDQLKGIDKKELLFICLSGFATVVRGYAIKSSTGWSGQRGGANRQAQYPCYDRLCFHRISREIIEEGNYWADPHCGRHVYHADMRRIVPKSYGCCITKAP